MIETISICSIVLIFILGIRGLFLIYKNRNFIKDIFGLYFLKFIPKLIFIFILVKVLFFTITYINIIYDYIEIITISHFKFVFFQIPNFLSTVILEEFVFRVLLFASLIHYIKNNIYLILFTSLLFSFYHFPNEVILFISYFIAGIMYGYAFVKYQSILVPIGIHFSWNFVQGAVFGYPVSGEVSDGLLSLTIIPNIFFNGGSHGPEGSIAGILMRLVIILVILAFPTPKENKYFLKFPKSEKEWSM
ncbi:CPBP family intramembrane glutamic endopeptidase [Pleomorphovibrio marinus]|uniref:CPBP family intramembrane glutamic endopeptidase n=1 Tax=Pleomorphovibrio marinus TaxID=2164132 RepID=UPI000E0CA380|nr:CPBP family intramembrane glutamic endopeptidase [Pleomorphovibrio marinus]